ncbi:hypothetical protein SH591_10730 [Sphingomonas sp. LY54]|uniref:hypothetical protein n=1 Tax=Sphingomonas sp. LY54 TaxID=3095343 RepID=UPI002D772ED0|nr:hypothetical protein [Sphingomonas sp. LY54]WRP27593.1 hypothetical protein SH591_10730 [Sphingomonas sp. LY54]
MAQTRELIAAIIIELAARYAGRIFPDRLFDILSFGRQAALRAVTIVGLSAPRSGTSDANRDGGGHVKQLSHQSNSLASRPDDIPLKQPITGTSLARQ